MKQTRKQIIEDKEKLILENFHKVSKQLGLVTEAVTIGDLEKNWNKWFPTVNNANDVKLVTDSQDVEQLKSMFPKAKIFDGFLVSVGDGDYDNIYGFFGNVPHLEKPVKKIK